MDLIQGQQTTFYLTFLDSGSAPIPSGISGTSITIFHFSSSTLVTDVSGAAMSQQSSPYEHIWTYNYTVPANQLTTSHNVVYNALFSGNTLQTTEVFNVFPASTSFSSSVGQGSVTASGIVVDASGNGLSVASIIVNSGNTVVASAVTNASGVYTVFVNPGEYLLSFFKEGYFPAQSIHTIPSGTMWNLGTQVLQANSQGSVIISDTFVWQTPELQLIPLPNLKISLFPKDSITGEPPTAIAYTDVSGTFVMNTNAGLFVMQVQGEFWNPTTSKNDRYNYTYDIEVNPVWSGTGVSGTSSPYNFQYLDTSKYNYIG